MMASMIEGAVATLPPQGTPVTRQLIEASLKDLVGLNSDLRIDDPVEPGPGEESRSSAAWPNQRQRFRHLVLALCEATKTIWGEAKPSWFVFGRQLGGRYRVAFRNPNEIFASPTWQEAEGAWSAVPEVSK
jgi:hypothetical protein